MYFTTCSSAFFVFASYTAILTAWMTQAEPPSYIGVGYRLLTHQDFIDFTEGASLSTLEL